MTQKTSRRRRARVRKRRKAARCIPSRNSSPRSNSRRSNPFSSNKQRPSSTGRRKCRVRLSSRRRRRSPHGDTGWISSVARRRLSGKITKVSLSQRHAISPSRRAPSIHSSHGVSTEPRARASQKNKQTILKPLIERSQHRLIIPASASSSSSLPSSCLKTPTVCPTRVRPEKTIKTIVFLEFHRVELHSLSVIFPEEFKDAKVIRREKIKLFEKELARKLHCKVCGNPRK